MDISEQSQAVLLLTAWLGKPTAGEAKPLTPTEWGRFALWLNEKSLTPAGLLNSRNIPAFLDGWVDRSIGPDRISGLLDRSMALGIVLERWQRAGLWVMSRSDPDYPQRLKKRLRFDAPPALYGCGNRQLLAAGGIAVVGSRAVDDADLAFTTRIGQQIALQGYSVVSGGARGVDEAAMLGALDREGTVTGVLADSLLRASSSSRYRRGLMDDNLVLVSPFNPEAGFSAGNAMARNKYVYCLADAAVVVASTKNKGGTWAGAIENLKRQWVPTWVKSDAAGSGNAVLVDLGARWLPAENLEVADLLTKESGAACADTASLFDAPAARISVREPAAENAPSAPVATDPSGALGNTSLYQLFLLKLRRETAITPLTAEQLQEKLELGKTQTNDWLKRAVNDGCVEKLSRPVRYQAVTTQQPALGL